MLSSEVVRASTMILPVNFINYLNIPLIDLACLKKNQKTTVVKSDEGGVSKTEKKGR